MMGARSSRYREPEDPAAAAAAAAAATAAVEAKLAVSSRPSGRAPLLPHIVMPPTHSVL